MSNEHLDAIFDRMDDNLHGEFSSTETVAAAARKAAMFYMEGELGLPVTVKYGEPMPVCEEYGRDQQAWNRVREAVGNASYQADPTATWLFYIEPKDEHAEIESKLHRVMLSLGAWYVGASGAGKSDNWLHHLYLLPDDCPVIAAYMESRLSE